MTHCMRLATFTCMAMLGAPFGRYRYWAYAVMALAAAAIIIYSLRRLRNHLS